MKLAIPKGRVLEKFIENIKKKGFIIKENRKIIKKIKKIKIIPIKQKDIIYYLKNKKIDSFIAGTDFYLENKKKLKKIKKKKINIFNCRLSIITRNKYELIEKFFEKKKRKIFTKYFNIAKNKFKKSKIKKLNGTLELSLIFKKSDYILDIVETGETIKENNLVEIKKIINIKSIFFFRKKKYLKKIKKII